MKWQIPSPKEGEKRTRRRFAWEPVTVMDNGISVRVWLEYYLVTEEFVKYKEAVIQEWKVLDRRAIKKG